jgi:hypothetical protein
MQHLIAQSANITGFALPENCCLVFSSAREVTIDAVVRNIRLASDEPFGKWDIPLEHLLPRLKPMQLRGDLGPKTFGIISRALPE